MREADGFERVRVMQRVVRDREGALLKGCKEVCDCSFVSESLSGFKLQTNDPAFWTVVSE